MKKTTKTRVKNVKMTKYQKTAGAHWAPAVLYITLVYPFLCSYDALMNAVKSGCGASGRA